MAIATNKGFWVYAIYPHFMKKIRRAIDGGLKLAQMIGISNILLLIPTGDNPAYRADNVILWDDKHLTSQLIDVTQDGSEVLSASYANDTYFIGKLDCLYVLKFNIHDHEKIAQIGPCENPRGIHSVSTTVNNRFCVATPNKDVGSVQLDWFTRTADDNGEGQVTIKHSG